MISLIRNTTLSFFVVFVFSTPLMAQSSTTNSATPKVSDCLSKFADKMAQPLSQFVEIKSLEQLPKKIFVAQTADYLVETKSDDFKLWARQSFVSGESRAVCASFQKASSLGISMYAPTLIDLSELRKTGDSFWQFHLMVSNEKVGIWNQRSRISTHAKDFLLRLQDAGVRVFMEARTPTNYQLHFIRKSEAMIEHLMIRYDLVDDLQ